MAGIANHAVYIHALGTLQAEDLYADLWTFAAYWTGLEIEAPD